MIVCEDCIVYMEKMFSNYVDAIVTDPPYGLEFMGKEWDKLWSDPGQQKNGGYLGTDGVYRVKTRPVSANKPQPKYEGGIQAQEWHYSWAAEALRVAKPGAHLLAFGGTRTFHRLTCAIEDAGWEIRDCLGWLHGQGFPKSLDVSKAIDRAVGAEREVVGRYELPDVADGLRRKGWDCSNTTPPGNFGVSGQQSITAPATDAARQWQGWGTALKPAWEPIILARKPLDGTVAANVQKWGTGAINVDGCRVHHDEPIRPMKAQVHGDLVYGQSGRHEPTTELKPSGRWPANIIHDGSDEVLELFPDSVSSGGRSGHTAAYSGGYKREFYGDMKPGLGDSGSAARFFKACPFEKGEAFRFAYCAKASRKEREAGLEGMEAVSAPNPNFGSNGFSRPTGQPERQTTKARNHHPTVKPLALMRYLCRLVTPPNGLILDPFCGSGTTGIAAKAEGFRFIGIDNNEEYCEIARKRIGT